MVLNLDDYYVGVDEKMGLEMKLYFVMFVVDDDYVIGVLICVNCCDEDDLCFFDVKEIVFVGLVVEVLVSGIWFYCCY